MNTNKKARVLMMAGGTGGHVIPALSVAKTLEKTGIEVEWLGTKQGLESTLVPNAQIPIHYISITGLRRESWLKRCLLPFRLAGSLLKSLMIIHRFKPNVVIGLGGFPTGPGGIAAWLLRCPIILHEQNAIAGTTNRILAKFAYHVLEGFPNSFPPQVKKDWIGNPIREEIIALPPPTHRFENRTGALKLLIVGGSQGALAINQLCPEAINRIPLSARPEIWHQTGKNHLELTQALYDKHQIQARVEPFIEDMAEAYGWADLVICRSGALTISELAVAGLPSILIPFPFAVDDHQLQNARFLEAVGGAIVVSQSVLTPDKLADIIKELSQDREKLLKMAVLAQQLAKPQASDKILAWVEKCLNVYRMK